MKEHEQYGMRAPETRPRLITCPTEAHSAQLMSDASLFQATPDHKFLFHTHSFASVKMAYRGTDFGTAAAKSLELQFQHCRSVSRVESTLLQIV